VADNIVVIGLGEIGRPLFDIIRTEYTAVGVDLDPVDIDGRCRIMHVCFPYESVQFIDESKRYISKYRPALTIINSTVAPGTTRAVEQGTGARVVHSPIRGKHWKMHEELLHYVKFIGGTDPEACREAQNHFQSLGMKTRLLSSPEATEIAKLSETTYFGLLITWAQEVERYCDQLGCDYDEVVGIYEDIGFFPPVKYTPGIIGGHCVMPNIDILQAVFDSDLLEAIRNSNDCKAVREAEQNERLAPTGRAGTERAG